METKSLITVIARAAKKKENNMKTKILFFILITILPLAIYSQSNDSTCHPPRNPSSPGGDNTDENFSFSEGTFKTSGINNTLILVSGFYKEADSLINGIFFDMPEIARNLLKISPVLVIPSGGFYGKENDTLLKIVLREYVSSGGNIVIFTQQYGAHTDSLGLLSGDEQGKNIGFREGQSCTFNSVFWEYSHPITSSQTTHAISMAVDGYTDTWPSTATVVLRHRLSGRPILLYYPYGEGMVFLASGMYSDWASAHSQMTAADKKIVRDLLTFARAPKLPIQMINYLDGTNPVINLEAKLVNPGETPAAKALIKVTTPDKDRVLFESTQDISLNPGGEVIIPISFTLPEIRNSELGIFHTLYQLLDADGQPLQWETESLTARFAVYRNPTPYQSPKGCSVWVTAKKDFFYWYELADLEIHVKNYTSEPITMDWYYDWMHQGHNTLPTVPVPDNGEIHLPIQVDLPQRSGRTSTFIEMFWVHHRISEDKPYICTGGKGINVKYPRTLDTAITVTPGIIKNGDSITYVVKTKNGLAVPLENTGISVALEKRQWPDYVYTTLDRVYETTLDLGPGQAFSYTGTYCPTQVLAEGLYRLKLEITRADNTTETAVTHFSVVKSYISAQIHYIEDIANPMGAPFQYLEVGKTYPFRVEIRNHNFYWGTGIDVTAGQCTLIVQSETGAEAFRFEQTGIALEKGKTLTLNQPFTFHPPEPGKYFLKIKYEDETGTVIETFEPHFYIFKNYLSMVPNPRQLSYRYGESMTVDLVVKGSGTFNLIVDCEAENYREERIITLAPGNANTLLETFHIPTTFANSSGTYTRVHAVMVSIDPNCTGAAGVCARENRIFLKRETIMLQQANGTFGAVSARTGDPMEFQLQIGSGTGYVAPLTGELRVAAPGLGFENLQTVSIDPLGENRYNYSIPVPAGTAAGTYTVTATFQVEGRTLLSRGYSIELPAPGIEPAVLASDLIAGETYSLGMTNPGGKDGHYEISGSLKDRQGKTLLDFSHTLDIAAGEQAELPLTLPASLAGGSYILVQHVKETNLNQEITHYTQHRVTGPEAALNVYTAKDTYFAGETVTGKSEITAGNKNLTDCTLDAEIVKLIQTRSIEKIHEPILGPILDTQGRLWGGTDTGIARYSENSWQEYTRMPDGTDIGFIETITAGPGGTVFALTEAGIVVLDGADIPNMSVIPYWGPSPRRDIAAVDKLSRLWMVYYGEMNTIAYYDQNGWNYYSTGNPGNILCDSQGGVWLIYETRLTHVNPDLSAQTWTTSTGFPADGIYTPYVDIEGILWFTTYNYELYSFDGVTWTDYSSYEGNPPNGMAGVTGDETGHIYGIGINDNWRNQFYSLENSQWVKIGPEFYSWSSRPVVLDGYFYANGTLITGGSGGGEGEEGEEGEFISGLLKIGGSSGTGLETLWNQTYSSIEITSGSTIAIDLNPNLTPAPGYYILHTQLKSSLDQVLAESRYSFVVRDTAVSVTLAGQFQYGRYVKKETDFNVTLGVLNNTAENKDNLQLTVKKTSPGGTETEMLNQALSLAPDQSYTDTLELNEAETGAWTIAAEIKEGDVVLSGADLVLTVVEPLAQAEISSPAAAGDEAFAIETRLTNKGGIDAEVSCVIQETGTTESLLLKPGEESIVQARAAIANGQDFTYTVTLSGDIEKTETRTVKYGYTAQLTVQVQPVQREGLVAIPYEIANTGGLPFTGTVNFRLYGAGGLQPGIPLAAADRSYNLYPGAPAQTDALYFELPAGNYILTYNTPGTPGPGQEQPFAVQPSGLGTLTLLSQPGPVKIPVGSSEIRYQVTNNDTAAGTIPVQVVCNYGETQTLAETREYYLQPGETSEDEIAVSCTEPGSYSLLFSGAKLTGPVQCPIQALTLEAVTASLETGDLADGAIPVTVSIVNNGYRDFHGQVVLAVEGKVYRDVVTVVSGSQFEGTFRFDTGALSTGGKEFQAYLYDEAGQVLAEKTAAVAINSADIQVIEVPQNLVITAGSYAVVPMKLKNLGHLSGEALLKLTAFDNFYREYPITLAPGQETELVDMILDVEGDIPSGNYPVHYTLSGPGTAGGTRAGNFYVQVEGLALEVGASLDRTLYNPGETAALTLQVSSTTSSSPSAVPLEAVVNWGNFSETRAFTLENGSAALVFNIPLDEARAEKIFYGIYHEEGKGIHLNDIYLNFRGDSGSGGISLELDKQVYTPGEIVHAVFTAVEGEQPGVLTASAFEETYTMEFTGTASASFQVPSETLGGTYGVSWSFAPTDIAQPRGSGSRPFDVSGLVVKTAKAELEKGKYTPGETLNAHYIFEANRDQTLVLRCWTTTPTRAWEYLGESSVTVSAGSQVDGLSSYPFTTTEAGTHHFAYGLYQEEQLVVSGSMAFDVGDAVLLGISPDRQEYKTGSEPVQLTLDYFGQGSAQLEIYLEDEILHQQSVTLNGIGSTEIVLDSSRIEGGTHTIKAVFTQDGLTSTKITSITYGTDLPDLTVEMVDTIQDGLNYTYKLEVVNNGKTANGATSIVFSDNGVEMGTVNIPALEPDSFYETTFTWNGNGKAGTHEMVFEVDKSGTVKEFCETNNSVEITEEVPALYYTLEMNPPDLFIYPAHTPMNIVTRLINNQGSPIQLNLDLSIANNETGAIVHNRAKEEQIPAFSNTDILDTFNTGLNLAGSYTIRQLLSGVNASLTKEIPVIIEPTPLISGTLQVQPQQIPANTPTEVQLTMALKNAGNVPLEDETLQIAVFNKDQGEVVISEEMAISIPLAEEITETKTMSLNLVEGNYEIWLKHNEEIIALADLTARSALKPSQTIGIYPRVLIMNLLPPAARGTLFEKTVPLDPPQKLLINFVDYLTALLKSQGIEYEIGLRLIDSYVKLNKGQANVNVVLGNEMGRNLRDELKEKVFHGEGLILFCDKPAQNPEWTESLGVTIKPIPGKTRETVIQILPNEFSSEGEIQFTDKVKLQMIKEKEDVVIIAQTKQKQYPVMAYRKYGKGHILIIAVPLEFKPGIEHLAQLLLNTIARFSQDIYSVSELTRLLPLELSLKNESTEAKTLKIKTFLPYGVEAFDFEPKPEEGEELKWTITIPVVSTKTVSYWLKLPDQVNTFEIKTELFEEETKLDEVSISFEVTQTVLNRINELIMELEMTGAVGKEAHLVSKAKHHLEQIRNRTGNSFMEHLLNLHDSIKAASYLGEVKSVDVSARRLKTHDIMVIMGRRFYEAIKTWGEVQLNSILELL
jgi:hypothetical protein